MNKYFKIGLFSISGFVLFSIAIVMFGAGALLEQRFYLETYFNESVQGLSVGAPVKYRGVQVGSVEEIGFCNSKYETKNITSYVYIKIALYPKLIGAENSNFSKEQRKKRITSLIDGGMHTRLAQQGITGLAYVEMDYIDSKKNLDYDWEPEHNYIPSAQSTISQVSKSIVGTLEKIDNVDFIAMGKNINKLILTVDKLVSTVEVSVKEIDVEGVRGDFQVLLKEINKIAIQVEQFSGRINEFFGDSRLNNIPGNIAKMMDNFTQMTSDLQRFTVNLEPISQKLGDSADQSIQNFGQLGRKLETLTEDVNVLVNQEELKQTIAEMPKIAKQWTIMSKRFNAIVRANQSNMNQVMRNFRIFSENLKQISKNAEKFPSQLLFGEPPKQERKQK